MQALEPRDTLQQPVQVGHRRHPHAAQRHPGRIQVSHQGRHAVEILRGQAHAATVANGLCDEAAPRGRKWHKGRLLGRSEVERHGIPVAPLVVRPIFMVQVGLPDWCISSSC